MALGEPAEDQRFSLTLAAIHLSSSLSVSATVCDEMCKTLVSTVGCLYYGRKHQSKLSSNHPECWWGRWSCSLGNKKFKDCHPPAFSMSGPWWQNSWGQLSLCESGRKRETSQSTFLCSVTVLNFQLSDQAQSSISWLGFKEHRLAGLLW